MWWTQPRLTLAACSMYLAAYVVVVSAVPASGQQFAALAAVVTVILVVYRRASLTLAAKHADGRMRDAFDRAVWDGHWKMPDFLNLSLAAALDKATGFPEEPTAGERFQAPLARATSLLEAARMRTAANWFALAAGLSSGLLLHALPWPGPSRHVLAALLMPLTVSSLLGVLVDHAAAKALIREGNVSRIASLVPRALDDLSLRSWSHPARLAMLAGLGAFLLGGAWYFGADGARLAVALLCAGYVALTLAAEHFALQQLPLLRFVGPPEISAFIDQQLRASRIRLVSMPSPFLVVAVAGLWDQLDFLPGVATGMFVTAHVMFVQRPDVLARRGSSQEIAAHLHGLQQRWGLNEDVARSSIETPPEPRPVSP